ncbi:S8 family serine peptidase [Dactylosporangium salmoneum]|uniref:S8 family serine peptidase n=1 Tax=Dactylosporangium salmoneum TaxID=53361 RepID=UPI0031E1C897
MRIRPRPARSLATVACGAVLALAFAAPAAADPTRDQQWALGLLKADQLAQISQGEGVTVAVINTGVDPDHPDLTGSVLKGINTDSKSGPTSDMAGIGTGMASIIAGHGHGAGGRDGIMGIAPKAKILPVRLGDQVVFGQPDRLAAGIMAATDAGAKVICVAYSLSDSDYLLKAIGYAWTKGAVVVAASGKVTDNRSIVWPARYKGVVAVGVAGKDGNADPEVSPEGDFVSPLTVIAPGVDIVAATLRGKYETGSSTVHAAAYVAGVAALIMAKYPSAAPAGVLQRLQDSAEDRGKPGLDDTYGYGLVDPVKALAANVPRRAAPSAGASGSAAPTPAPAGPKKSKFWYRALLGTTITLICASPVALVVGAVLLIRRSRRRRRAARASAASAAP